MNFIQFKHLLAKHSLFPLDFEQTKSLIYFFQTKVGISLERTGKTSGDTVIEANDTYWLSVPLNKFTWELFAITYFLQEFFVQRRLQVATINTN